MSRHSIVIAGLVALAAWVAGPQQTHAQYGGCTTCATVPAYQPMVVRYGLFGRPRAVYYAPTVAVAPVTPVATYYTPAVAPACSTCPTTTYYAPACTTCPTCPTGGCATSCSTCYSPTIVNVPVTTYRPVAACDPCGNTVTVMRPVTSYVQRVQYTPQTVCSPCSTVSYSPVTCAPGCTGCSVCSPATCGPNCTGCAQCAPSTSQPQYQDQNSYPQTQPGYGQPSTAPQTFQGERPQTSAPAQQPVPQTAPQQPIPYPSQPHTSGSNYSPANPQLIDPDSRTTQAPRSWSFQRAVAQESDLAARIIPVSQPAQQAAPQVDDGWRAAQPR